MTGTPNNSSHPVHIQNGNGIKKNGLHDQGGPEAGLQHCGSSGASSTSTLTGQRGPIPLTIKTLEAENKRKTLLAEAAAAAAGKFEIKILNCPHDLILTDFFQKFVSELTGPTTFS